jgi:hypothetical protein
MAPLESVIRSYAKLAAELLAMGVLAACGSVSPTTPGASADIAAAPLITTQPADQTVNLGQTATFSVVATGTAPLSYQWSKNGSPIAGATAAAYVSPATAATDNGATFSVLVTNAVGDAASSSATLTVNSPPVITTQPTQQTVPAGQTATFVVVAVGTAPLSYQWSENAVPITGATAAAYTTPITTLADSGSSFAVVVTNAAGSAPSVGAMLTVTPSTVNSAPLITTQPVNQTVPLGQMATFVVVATGTVPLSYQWSKNGSPIAGATAASYTTPATTATDNGATFSVLVTNVGGNASSSSATLTVTSPPVITTQPANQTVTLGHMATFSVVASGTAPLSYQWSKNGTPIAGATATSYTTPATTATDNGATFSVLITNVAGNATSNTATLTVNSAPVITTQPANQTVTLGHMATFSVVATGTAPLSYQWSKNGSPIVGATAASYTTPSTTAADNGATFSVLVTNVAGNAMSSSATLTVNSPPVITTQPANQTVTLGHMATFSVAATGTAPLSYQWSKNGNPIAGATAASYTTPATTATDNGATFSVLVTNAFGNASSNSAVLTVNGTSSSTDVVTYKNDVSRTGQNLTESILTLSNVNSTDFGLLYNITLDGNVDAQPLYLSQFSINGSVHNVVYVATENDSVYAFDADSGQQLWHVSLMPTGESTSDAHSCNQITPMIGITSTPVIDRSAGALYVVAMTKDSSQNYHQRLHALSISTGAELSNSPAEIQATWGSTTFVPGRYAERAALLLENGIIYTSWTSHCDQGPYGGWIIAYNESTLSQAAALNVGPGGIGTGFSTAGPAIWMSGGGPGADAMGNIYLLTGNGVFEPTLDGQGFPSGGDYGNSFLKLSLSGGVLSVSDYFTMYNEVSESSNDQDLGSGGELLLPDLTDSNGTVKHLVVGAGKDGNVYVVNRDAMGEFNASSNNIWQPLDNVTTGIFSTPAYFNNTVYYGGINAALRAFPITNALMASTPSSVTTTSFQFPGTAPAISANGTANAIIWAYQNSSPAVLHAYDATNLGNELYNSNQAANDRDQFGNGNKFITPSIADGKVFVGGQNCLAIFGLLN